MTNPAVGRTSPYSWWQSQLKGSGTLTEAAPAGATNVRPSSTANYHIGGTINIDTGNGGDNLESRVITGIGTTPTTVAAPNVVSGSRAPSLTGANWIWNVAGAATVTPAGTIYLRKTFDVVDPAALASAVLRVNADDGHTTFVNGTQVWRPPAATTPGRPPRSATSSRCSCPAPTSSPSPPQHRRRRQRDRGRRARGDQDRDRRDLEGAPRDTGLAAGRLEHRRVRRLGVGGRDVTGAYGIGPGTRTSRPRPGPNTLRVASVEGFAVGHTIQIDTGANQETKVIQTVGTAGANGSGLTLTTPLTIVHAVGAPVVNLTNPDTGISFTPALDQSHAAGPWSPDPATTSPRPTRARVRRSRRG